MLSNNI